jgi:hypothetical protein
MRYRIRLTLNGGFDITWRERGEKSRESLQYCRVVNGDHYFLIYEVHVDLSYTHSIQVLFSFTILAVLSAKA